ncbi:hypothetical protein [Calycomorphotria hydatis]|uniref:Uncharacterized protein n=1 Tax=Calycomorphotria hydatis TaxID=2528027 RepID=A0A517T8Q1_9PLAN|nr:hypothetical protein [Calycomorphotria hydatis]QDT64761.1 hypothetical protein V22_20020 [Calycomorphotria hydatis]
MLIIVFVLTGYKISVCAIILALIIAAKLFINQKILYNDRYCNVPKGFKPLQLTGAKSSTLPNLKILFPYPKSLMKLIVAVVMQSAVVLSVPVFGITYELLQGNIIHMGRAIALIAVLIISFLFGVIMQLAYCAPTSVMIDDNGVCFRFRMFNWRLSNAVAERSKDRPYVILIKDGILSFWCNDRAELEDGTKVSLWDTLHDSLNSASNS